MDVYHKVLTKLYQVTGGKDSQIVDLKDLIKGLGFLGNYEDISQMLSGQGWVAETPKLNYVRITHWGVKEVKNSSAAETDNSQLLKSQTISLIADTKQFLILLQELSNDLKIDNLSQAQKKLNDINSAIVKLQTDIK